MKTYDEIVKEYPQLFRGRCRFIECSPGWADLIEQLCSLLEWRYSQDVRRLEYLTALNEPIQGKESAEKEIKLLTGKLSDDEDGYNFNYPVVSQVKEKFGELRFYVDYASESEDGYVTMAEHMSSRICETCGNSGKMRSGGWVITLCDSCDEANKKRLEK